MLLQYNQFYLKFGNRSANKLTNPRIFRLTQFKLPKSSCYHFYDENEPIPSHKTPLLAGYKLRMPMITYTDTSTRLGTLTRQAFNSEKVLRDAIRQDGNHFIKVDDLKKLDPNPLVPLIVNHALADKRHKYIGNEARIPYYKEMNILNNIIRGMVDVYNAHGATYQQFLVFTVPNKIPSMGDLKRAASTVNTKFFANFNTLEKLLIFELWKWIGIRKEQSVFAKLPEALLKQINIVFTYNNLFTVFNLGDISNWVMSKENPKGKLDIKLTSKYFLIMLVRLFKANRDTDLIEDTEKEILTKRQNEENKGTDDEQDNAHPSQDSTVRPKHQDVDETEEDEDEVEDPDTGDIEELLNTKDDLSDLDFASELFDEEDDGLEVLDKTEMRELTHSRVVSEDKAEAIEIEEVTNATMQTQDALGLANIKPEEIPVLIKHTAEKTPPEVKARKVLDELAQSTAMSQSKYDGIKKALSKYKTIQLDHKSQQTVAEMIDIKPEEVAITEKDREISTLNVFTPKYVEEVLGRDVASMIVSVQAAGVVVQDIKKTEVDNIAGAYTAYSIKVKPIEGQPSTIRVRIPKVDKRGIFKIGNKEYFYKTQRFDLPIRKINPDTVSLSSYFGKTFVRRNELRPYNYEKWLISLIRQKGFDKEDNSVLETRSANVFDNYLKAPYIYSLLSKHFRAITVPNAYLYFDHKQSEERFGKDVVNSVIKYQLTFAGLYQKKHPIGVSKDNLFFYIDGNELKELGSIEDIIQANSKKIPLESLTVDIMSKKIPLGLILSYYLGFDKLLAALKPKHYRTIETGRHPKLSSTEYQIRFKDYTVILDRRDRMTSLIMSSFSRIEDTYKYSVFQLNEKEVYFNLLESIGIPGRYTKEFSLYNQMFVDPITEEILIEMGEPTDWIGLLMRSVELLVTLDHPDETDGSMTRFRGYERMAGEIYTQLVRSIREHNRHGIKENYPLELHPEAVWMSLIKDTTKQIKETLNPIQDLKEVEITTTVGNGGRSKQSMVKHTRAHNQNSIGVLSEASVDSSDAGVTVYMSSNPLLKSLRGLPTNSNTMDKNKDLDARSVLSTTGNMLPCSDMDDPKRQNFAQVQMGHTIAASSYSVMPTRTGYDDTLAKRCSDTFATIAEQDGAVLSVDDYMITVKYKDGTERSIELGRKFGHSGGFTTTHDVITKLKPNTKFKAGDALAYNEGFFTEDTALPGKLAYKGFTLVRAALMEHPYTYEDSCAVSAKYAQSTKVRTVKEKEVVVGFDQSIHRLAKPGTVVKIDDPLCFIESSLTANTGMFDEDTIDLLRNVSALSPRSPVNGVIDKIEVYYNGDMEDMSDSLRNIARLSNTNLAKRQKALGKSVYTGEVDETYRVNGNPLTLDSAVIIFTITTEQGLVEGDKTVLGNQLKNTIGHVFTEPPRTANNDLSMGEEVDAIFSTTSLYKRIVNSPFLMGMNNTLLVEMSKRIGQAYIDEKMK